jgi:hypothetical protein
MTDDLNRKALSSSSRRNRLLYLWRRGLRRRFGLRRFYGFFQM